jgi:hypothetical protein
MTKLYSRRRVTYEAFLRLQRSDGRRNQQKKQTRSRSPLLLCIPVIVHPVDTPPLVVLPPATTSSQKQRARTNWKNEEHFPILHDAVSSYLNDGEDTPSLALVPRQTVKDNMPRFLHLSGSLQISLEEVTRQMFYPERGYKKRLLDKEQFQLLCDTIIHRDQSNNGMSRHEVISMIMELSQSSDFKACENLFDHLIRIKALKGLKRNGRVVAGQKTSTKRLQITVEQQLRWHTTVDDALAELKRLNLPTDEFEVVNEHFIGNFDESCLLGNDGCVKVVASELKSKTEKMMDDCHASITSIRVGMASGDQGPFIFLINGKKVERKPMRDLVKNYGCPPGSVVIPSPNAFMTDAVWLSLVPFLAEGIRQMPVIRDHPDWWVAVSCDGFGSHVNVHAAHEIFSVNKIMVVKEEGDTSHVNQAYDQSVAKQDMTLMRQNLERVRRSLGFCIDQYYLIAIAIDAQKKVPKRSWVESFVKVNMHPKHRVPFYEWIKILDNRGLLVSGEKFFEKRTTLYDVMRTYYIGRWCASWCCR